jgi:hypothetical protein
MYADSSCISARLASISVAGGSEDKAISWAIFAVFAVRPWKEICPPGTLSDFLTAERKERANLQRQVDVIQFKSKSFNKPSLRS